MIEKREIGRNKELQCINTRRKFPLEGYGSRVGKRIDQVDSIFSSEQGIQNNFQFYYKIQHHGGCYNGKLTLHSLFLGDLW